MFSSVGVCMTASQAEILFPFHFPLNDQHKVVLASLWKVHSVILKCPQYNYVSEKQPRVSTERKQRKNK